ncbi:MAG: aldo/keto reductase [Thaumarchaeota archaeon]|nr:aldo/keto reductase [Nitrososphaerota archaeon]
MEYRKLGRTGEKVSTIGMGTWRMGVYSHPGERSTQVAALRRGIQLGINLIDTAEIYAGGRSEEVVGEAVRGVRDDVLIATKVSPSNLGHDSVISACEGSLRRLDTSYIDLYQVHWPNPSVPIKETMAAMEELVRAGKVRYIGVSNFTVDQTVAAREALAKEELASNQVEYSLLNRSVEADLLPYCEEERLSLIAYTPIAKGKIPESKTPRALLEKYAMTPVQLALNWVTHNEQVLAIPKSSSIAHTEENVGSVATRFTDSEYDLISKA